MKQPEVIILKSKDQEQKWLKKPIREYSLVNKNRNLIGFENKKRAIIYQWYNVVTGQIYIGSASNGATRLLSYWRPSILRRSYLVYTNLKKYGKENFELAILEDLGNSGEVTKENLLEMEQKYLDILFKNFEKRALNLAKTAGSTKGYKHKIEFGLNRTGELNPMFDKEKSKEFIEWQYKDKTAHLNPMFGLKHSEITRQKLTKLIYVYNEEYHLIGTYSTIACIKTFKIDVRTLKKYIIKGALFKGKRFSYILI